MIVTQQPSMSTTKLEEGIVGVDRASNQAVIQQFSRTSPGVDLNFQRPGFVLQDRTIVCWLNMAGNSEKGKMLFLARSMCNHVIFNVQSHNRYVFVHTPHYIEVIIH